MKRRKMIFTACLFTALFALTGCGNSDSSAEVKKTPEIKRSNVIEAMEIKKEKPEILREGIIVKEKKYACNDEQTLMYEYIYNDDGNLLKKHDTQEYTYLPDTTVEMEYNSEGKTVKETENKAGDITINEYDENGLLIKTERPYLEGSVYAAECTYEYEFDENSNPISCTEIGSGKHLVWKREYENGQVKKETSYGSGYGTSYVSSETIYDDKGNKIGFTKYDENGKEVSKEQYIRHYANGVIVKEKNLPKYGENMLYEIDSDGYLVKIQSLDEGFTVEFENDCEGNPTTARRLSQSGDLIEETQNQYEYEYDQNGNKTKETQFGISGDRTYPVYCTEYEYAYKD